jgi:choline dehydrogenase
VTDFSMQKKLVVVGAGSAGSVIAARIVERGHEVVLIEAGPDYADIARLPPDLVDGGRNSMVHHDWGYRHRPTLGQVVFPLPRGRVVGGSSAVNTCIALRGQPADYDEWAALGLDEWSFEKCLPAFKRLENDLDFGGEWHGQEGPLPIRRHPPEELVVWQAAFVEAARELGFPACPDTNVPGSHGVGPHAMNKLNGRRISAAEAWLTPRVRQNPGFRLLANTHVRRVLFQNARVTGVETECQGVVSRIQAEMVVLAAGAINTPHLLLCSGVGPSRELARLGVEQVADVPGVGRRLVDHPGTAIFLRPRFGSGIRRGEPLIQTVLRYGSKGSGHANDMMLQPGSKVNLPRIDFPLVSLMCAVNKSRGTGTLHFRSTKAGARPIIDSLLLEDAEDRNRAIDAMWLARDLARTRPLDRLAAHFWPRASVLRDRDKSEAWIRKACDSGYHPSGTVPMGVDGDPHAAADGRGHVRSVKGLIVADASLMPTIPAANLHLTVLMMGERFAEWIAADLA